MEPTVAKLIALVILVVLTLLFSVLPFIFVLRRSKSIVSTRRREVIIEYLNCFAGGVFLGTLLLHLLTEGSEEFENYKAAVHYDSEYPFFNIFVAVGFFMVALIEKAAHSLMRTIPEPEKRVDKQVHVSGGHYGSLIHEHLDRSIDRGCEYHRNSTENPRGTGTAGEDTAIVAVIKPEGHVAANGQMESAPAPISSAIFAQSAQQNPQMRMFLLLMALSFHTVFDGLAVGLQDATSEVWQVFAAIAVHKSIIAFCMGLEFFRHYEQKPCRAFLWMCLFSLMSPIGIGIGTVVTSSGIDNLAKMLASSILQGLASGTFLYITFLEILCAYMGHSSQGNYKHIFCALVGFSLMAGVKVIDHD